MENTLSSADINLLMTIIYWFVGLYLAVSLIGLWKIFEKAGRPGIFSLIPIYNLYVLLKIINRPGWWLILIILQIPLITSIIYLVMSIDLAKAFGRSSLFGVVVIGFITPVGLLILGLGDSKYSGVAGKSAGSSATPEPQAQPIVSPVQAPVPQLAGANGLEPK